MEAGGAAAVTDDAVDNAGVGASSDSREYGGGGGPSLSSFCKISHSWYDWPSPAPAPEPEALELSFDTDDPETNPVSVAAISSNRGLVPQ